jgi:hypothetical protein
VLLVDQPGEQDQDAALELKTIGQCLDEVTSGRVCGALTRFQRSGQQAGGLVQLVILRGFQFLSSCLLVFRTRSSRKNGSSHQSSSSMLCFGAVSWLLLCRSAVLVLLLPATMLDRCCFTASWPEPNGLGWLSKVE